MCAAETDRRSLRSVGYVVVSAISLGYGGLAFGALLLALVVVGLGLELTPILTIVLGLVFVQGIGCIGVALAYLRFRPAVAPAIRDLLGLDGDPNPFDIDASVPDLTELAVVAAGYVLAFVGAMVGGAIITLLSVDPGQNQAGRIGMEYPETLLVLIPASILVVGPGEELLFRGVVQGRLRQVFGPVVGILLPSVAFAAVHWFALVGGSTAGNLAAVSLLVAPTVVFGASYEYTDNIVVPALIHGVYNATIFSLIYYAAVYADDLPESATLVVSSLA